MDLISVIVPVYNVENYLCRCVNSILNQTYTNLEIILVDDGSTDSSGSLCDELKEKDRRIKVIHKENGGLSSARNIGVEKCHGDWVAFIDSDDFVKENYIEVLYDLCKENNVLISQCGAVRGEQDTFPEETVDIINEKWLFSDMYKSSRRAFRCVAWGKLIKTEIVKKYPFPIGKIFEDEAAIFKCMYSAKESMVTNRHLYYYFMSDGSILRNTKKRVNFDMVDIFDERCSFLEENGEGEMIEYTKKELCIRLLLGYCEAKKENKEKTDINKLRKLFVETYRKTNWKSGFPRKEIVAIKLFYYVPDLFAFIENKLGIIHGAKYRREKK